MQREAAAELARDLDVRAVVCGHAHVFRREDVGDEVTYVVNRNINYTNICYFKRILAALIIAYIFN